jgi:uncharacterized protein with von Willebrand factor type A (vWA) domain
MYLFDLKGLFGKYKTFAIEPDSYCRVAWRNRRRRSYVVEQNIASLKDDELKGFSSDIFQSLMNGEFEESSSALKWAEECFSICQDVEEFEILQEMCSGDADFSAISTGGFMKSLSSELLKIKGLSNEIEQKEKQLEESDDEDEKNEIYDLMSELEFEREQNQAYAKTKVQTASMEAMKEVTEMQKLKDCGFFGSEFGSNKMENQQSRWDLVERFKRDESFKKVLLLAGRIKSMGDEAVVESTDTPESFVGFTSGNNFDGIQLEDLTMMSEPDLENLFWADYCDETLLVDLYKGTKKRSGGDIVICSDVSGSMSYNLGKIGKEWVTRHELCRAFCFAAMIKCKQESRNIVDIAFDSKIRKITNDPHESLEVLCGGGTNFNHPLREAIKFMRESNRKDTTDVIFVTDGESDASSSYLEAIKSMGSRLWLYTIGSHHNYALLRASHRSFLLSDLGKSMEDLVESIKDN